MADNILKAIVQIDTKGVPAAVSNVSNSVGKAETSLKKLSPASGQATQSLVNLSRVAQDAPYGFIGIANNINPLLESFQRLKVETGSNKGALQALKGALMGPAGIGLAVGAVSSLLVVFGDRLFGSSKRTKELKEEAERLQKVLSEVSKTKTDVTITGGANAAEEIAKASALVKIIGDQTNSYKTRNAALVQLQKINKNYFGDLDIEKTSVSQLTKLVNEYSNALIAQETKQLLGGDIAKLNVEHGKALNKYNADLKELAKAEQELRKAQSYQEVDRNGNVIYTYGAKVLAAQKKVDGFNKSLSSSGKSIQQVNDQIVLSNELLKSAYLESLKFKPLTSVSVGADKVKIRPSKIGIDFSKINFMPTGEMSMPPVEIDVQPKPLSEEERKKWLFGENKFSIGGIGLPKNLLDTMAAYDEQQKKSIANAKMQASVITSVLTPAFQNMFSTIASGGNAFKAFGDAAAQALMQVISKLLTTAILSAILGPLLGAGSAMGASSSKFGDVFKFLMGGVGLAGIRANGGPVQAGKRYLVGERGMEIFTPSTSGMITPNHAINSYSGGGMAGMFGSVVFEISGNRLVGVLANAGRSQGRLV